VLKRSASESGPHGAARREFCTAAQAATSSRQRIGTRGISLMSDPRIWWLRKSTPWWRRLALCPALSRIAYAPSPKAGSPAVASRDRDDETSFISAFATRNRRYRFPGSRPGAVLHPRDRRAHSPLVHCNARATSTKAQGAPRVGPTLSAKGFANPCRRFALSWRTPGRTGF